MHDDGVRVFLEVGPGGVLTGFVGDILRDRPHLALAADSRRAPGLEHLLGVLGQLFINQVPFDLAPLHALAPAEAKMPAKMPPLESALPFIRLSDDETARVRTMLSVAAPAAASAPAPLAGPAESAMANEWDRPSMIAGWSGCLPLPFAARIEMVSLDDAPDGALDPAWFAEHLGAGDMDYFAQTIAPLGAWRQRDWLVGRMAARRAVTTWLADGGEPSDGDPQIGYDPGGRPVLTQATGAPIFLSVSHKDGIGAAAATDRPVGIDLERLTAVRDPDLMMQSAFSAEEGAVLAEAGWAQSELIAIAWSAKEAAAKAIGQQLIGQETAFAITHVDLAQETIRLAHAEGDLDAFYALDGDYVCVVAAAA